MQDYYLKSMFNNKPSAVVPLSSVGTLAECFLGAFGPIVQICANKYGIRKILIFGTLLHALGLEMAGFAHKIWHLYLTQSILYGLGSSCLLVAAITVPVQWFERRRGLAQGAASGGTAIGGLVIPFIMTAINGSLGGSWTYRILGFICLALNCMACLFIKERKIRNGHVEQGQAEKRGELKISQGFDFSIFKDKGFLIFMVGANVAVLGYLIPLYYIPYNARYLGMSDEQGSSLLAMISGTSFVGRMAAGYLGDRIGHLNSYIAFHVAISVTCFVLWTFATNFSLMMVFSVAYGLVSGAYFALLSPIMLLLLGSKRMVSGVSIMLMVNVLAYFGVNIASALEAYLLDTKPGYEPFFSYKIFTGTVNLLGAIITIFLQLYIKRSRNTERN